MAETLTREEAEAFGSELDALRREVIGDLGSRDVAHIRNVIRAAHYGEAGAGDPRRNATVALDVVAALHRALRVRTRRPTGARSS